MSQLKVNSISDSAGANGNAITLASDGSCTVKATNNLSNRNLIINGSMKCAQRTSSTTTNNTYSVDRFKVQSGGLDEALTNAQVSLSSSDTGPWEKGFRNALQITNGNQTSGAGAADYIEIYYHIEDQDIAQSGWDYTSASSKITLSYWIKSSVAQKFYGFIYSREAWTGNGKAYSYEISNGGSNLSANTWTKITHTIPGNSGLVFDNDNTGGLGMAIIPFHGTDVTNPSNTLNTWAAWVTANKTPDMTSTWYTTNDATLAITGMQLEVSDHATEFEHLPYGVELARCHRYCYADRGTNDYHAVAQGHYNGTTAGICMVYTPVAMRAAPALYYPDGTWICSGDAGTVNQTNIYPADNIGEVNAFQIRTTVSGAESGEGFLLRTASAAHTWYLDAEL